VPIVALNGLSWILDKIQNRAQDGVVPATAPASPTAPADLLREHGLQVTAQRLAVLRAVGEQQHCTADEVIAVVRDEIGTISRQAAYDALGVLVTKGLLRRFEPAGHPARYERRVGDNHHHLVCRTCGAIADVDCAAGRRPCLDVVDAQGFVIDEAEVTYWGRCAACLAVAPSP
jgi:Fur family ferric uptake transcriptional regulator